MKKSYEYQSDGKQLKKLLRAADKMMGALYAMGGERNRYALEYHAIREDVPEPRIMRDLLALADVRISIKEIKTWSVEQSLQAQRWAAAVHASASDNPVRVPPRPKFLPDRRMPDMDAWMNRIHRGEHIKKGKL